jgi:lipopolysaccharide biosynthesis protein
LSQINLIHQERAIDIQITDYKDLPRLIAFYLPQFYPIPENDQWWGKGFTEWANVTKAQPLFPGHYQPHLPADLGFYDLRLPETRQAQADLARQYDVYGFCYHHYWFQGLRLLGEPVNALLETGQPDFPFCLSWANESWTRRWDGLSHDYLMLQEFSPEDDLAHIRWLLRVFEDPRYIKIDNKPLFLVYNLKAMPYPVRTAQIWREEARRNGFPDLYLCKAESFADYTDPADDGFDAVVDFPPHAIDLVLPKLVAPYPAFQTNSIFDYARYVDAKLDQPEPPFRKLGGIVPAWDNTARHRNGNAFILNGSTPQLYQQWLRKLVEREKANNRPAQEKLVFINAWNEWAEGAHLEPDVRYGHAYLEATRRALHGEPLLETEYPPPPEMDRQWQLCEAYAKLNQAQIENLAGKVALERELNEVQNWALEMQNRLQQSNKSKIRRLLTLLRKNN